MLDPGAGLDTRTRGIEFRGLYVIRSNIPDDELHRQGLNPEECTVFTPYHQTFRFAASKHEIPTYIFVSAQHDLGVCGHFGPYRGNGTVDTVRVLPKPASFQLAGAGRPARHTVIRRRK